MRAIYLLMLLVGIVFSATPAKTAVKQPVKKQVVTVKKQGPLQRFLILQPQFEKAQMQMWPTFYRPSLFAAQIEQESNWKQYAQLKTSRELGRGLGQFTITYDKTGKEKMNVFEDIKKRSPKAFSSWNYRENPFDAEYQIKAFYFLNKTNYAIVGPLFKNEEQKAKAMFAAYNGGAGSVRSDYKLCLTKASKEVCSSWDGGVAGYSYKSRKPMTPEYPKSPFEINREYPTLVYQRAVKYIPYTDNKKPSLN